MAWCYLRWPPLSKDYFAFDEHDELSFEAIAQDLWRTPDIAVYMESLGWVTRKGRGHFYRAILYEPFSTGPQEPVGRSLRTDASWQGQYRLTMAVQAPRRHAILKII